MVLHFIFHLPIHTNTTHNSASIYIYVNIDDIYTTTVLWFFTDWRTMWGSESWPKTVQPMTGPRIDLSTVCFEDIWLYSLIHDVTWLYSTEFRYEHSAHQVRLYTLPPQLSPVQPYPTITTSQNSAFIFNKPRLHSCKCPANDEAEATFCSSYETPTSLPLDKP